MVWLTVPDVSDNIWQNLDRDYHVKILTKRLLRIDKDMAAEARTAFARWVPDGDMGAFARELAGRLKRDFTGTMALLRKPEFQELLLDYPRAKRTFLIGHEIQDAVRDRLSEERVSVSGTFALTTPRPPASVLP
jgi:type I restriction enzyme R subunit